MDTVTLETGVVLGAQRVGEGPTVLLNGGLGMPSMVWDICGLVDSLVGAGFSVITYHARGLAPSAAPPAPYSIADLADDAAGLLDHFDVQTATVVGFSMGCYTTQMMLRTRPELVRAAVLFAGLQPSPIGALVGEMELALIEQIGEIPRAVLVFEQLMTTLHTTLLQDPDTVAGWRDALTGSDGGWASPEGFTGQLTASYEWIKAGEPTAEQLARIDIPTLVLAFEHDLFFPPTQNKATSQLIPGSQFAQIDGAGHGGLFTGPGDSVRRITEFCARQH
ncbi:alpha/beta fold hydrolase [Nocardia sp. 348MFTsu5.1]|uniref:alpha/beta fold hydrolase n=1 Tax=Nocardia sp. 348MFTsu5.1 TaxID=1172185 RepID=UPI000376F6FB|nr:alpha/beta fold hydrolase [Nocardia sp. 348MFTsu5.1]